MSQELRYVVLRHEGVANPHFDLMVETEPGSLLQTWRVQNWPIVGAAALTHLAAHRRDYLTYEGPISGGRGMVKRVAEGECSVQTPATGQIQIISLSGSHPFKLNLRQIEGEQWTATEI